LDSFAYLKYLLTYHVTNLRKSVLTQLQSSNYKITKIETEGVWLLIEHPPKQKGLGIPPFSAGEKKP
jgi:hypothetical protein